jgi:hypothetical protein
MWDYLPVSVARAMAQAASRLPTIAETRFRACLSPRRICGGQSCNGTGLSSSFSGFSCQYHSTLAPYSYVTWGKNNRPLVAAVQRHHRHEHHVNIKYQLSFTKNPLPLIFLSRAAIRIRLDTTSSYVYLFAVYLPTIFSDSVYIAWDEGVIYVWWIGKDVEGRGRGLV